MRARRRSAGLTEREREVLAFVRLGLTNEEIAERLGITLDGAKYHVSQILAKLGVASRDEAAALPDERTPPWWARALAWSATAKIALAAAAVAVLVGVGVLAWRVVGTGGLEDEGAAAISVGTSVQSPTAPQTPATDATDDPSALVWQSDDVVDFVVRSDAASGCGDATTAATNAVPTALKLSYLPPSFASSSVLALDHQPRPYLSSGLVAIVASWSKQPQGWEMYQSPPPPHGDMRIGEVFLRRIDKPHSVFRYYSRLCDSVNLASQAPFPLHALQLTSEQPHIVLHTSGDYISADDAIRISRPGGPAYAGPVGASLGPADEIAEEIGLNPVGLFDPPDAILWVVVWELTDTSGAAPGHEYGSFEFVDATTGVQGANASPLDLILAQQDPITSP